MYKKKEEISIVKYCLHLLLTIQTLGKFGQELFENHRVDVLAHLVEDEPIADLALICDQVDVVWGSQATFGSQHHCADTGTEDNHETVHHVDSTDGTEQHEPEPQEHVDLLVEDVE